MKNCEPVESKAPKERGTPSIQKISWFPLKTRNIQQERQHKLVAGLRYCNFISPEHEVVPALSDPPGSPVSVKPMLVFPSILPFLNLSFPQPQPAMSSAQIRCAEPREVPLTQGQGEEGSLHLIVGQLQKT